MATLSRTDRRLLTTLVFKTLLYQIQEKRETVPVIFQDAQISQIDNGNIQVKLSNHIPPRYFQIRISENY